MGHSPFETIYCYSKNSCQIERAITMPTCRKQPGMDGQGQIKLTVLEYLFIDIRRLNLRKDICQQMEAEALGTILKCVSRSIDASMHQYGH
jgi:hypothetical protein